ncbi:hypothetical protein N9891_01645 [bacterium]|nr:hypothetical protein [bacterium]
MTLGVGQNTNPEAAVAFLKLGQLVVPLKSLGITIVCLVVAT